MFFLERQSEVAVNDVSHYTSSTDTAAEFDSQHTNINSTMLVATDSIPADNLLQY